MLMQVIPTNDPLESMTDAELQFLLDNLDQFDDLDAQETELVVDELQKRRDARACRDDLIEFCKKMQPDYKVGKHHRQLADLLMQIAVGDSTRVCVNMPPRHGKSQLVSIYFPAWFLGKFPPRLKLAPRNIRITRGLLVGPQHPET